MGKAVDTTVVLRDVPDTSETVVYAVRVTIVANGDAWMRLVQLTGASMTGLAQPQIMLSKTLTHDDLL